MMSELRRLNETKNEFLGIAAHDLRSPLGTVTNYANLLLRLLDQDTIDKDTWRRFLVSVRTTADEMLTLVDDLLDVTAIETGRVELRLARERMSKLLADREAFQRQSAEAKSIDLIVESDAAAVEILVDRVRIGEVLDNLMTNAVKYTSPGGRVRVYCESSNGELVTHVEDTGQGLRTEELGHVFSGRKLSARPTAARAVDRSGVGDRQEDRRAPRWPHLGGQRKGQGIDFQFQSAASPGLKQN